jgi:hypothetical protein
MSFYYYVTAWGTDFGPMTADEDFQGSHVESTFNVVAAGQVTSNIGEFSISFTAPTSQCLLRVVFEVPQDRMEFPHEHEWDADGYLYEEWPDHELDAGSRFYVIGGSLADDDVDVSSGGFRIGDEADVHVSMPVVDEDWTGVLWGVGDFTPEDMMSGDYDPAWSCWVPGGNIIYIDEAEAGEFEGDFIVPSFIDADKVTIVAGYSDADTGLPHYSAKTVGRAGGISLMLILALVAIAVIVVVVVVVIKMR